MRKSCASCGTGFEAKRNTAKYCSSRCRQRAYEHPERTQAKVAEAQESSEQVSALELPPGPVMQATMAELYAADRGETAAGAAAFALAKRIDYSQVETGSGMAALVREYRVTLAEALKDAKSADDELDTINQSAALKLLQGGRR